VRRTFKDVRVVPVQTSFEFDHGDAAGRERDRIIVPIIFAGRIPTCGWRRGPPCSSECTARIRASPAWWLRTGRASARSLREKRRCYIIELALAEAVRAELVGSSLEGIRVFFDQLPEAFMSCDYPRTGTGRARHRIEDVRGEVPNHGHGDAVARDGMVSL
jgi:hypothetical protein